MVLRKLAGKLSLGRRHRNLWELCSKSLTNWSLNKITEWNVNFQFVSSVKDFSILYKLVIIFRPTQRIMSTQLQLLSFSNLNFSVWPANYSKSHFIVAPGVYHPASGKVWKGQKLMQLLKCLFSLLESIVNSVPSALRILREAKIIKANSGKYENCQLWLLLVDRRRQNKRCRWFLCRQLIVRETTHCADNIYWMM